MVATIAAVYNDSLDSPGYEITLGNLTDDADHDSYRVICRDPEGRYPDQIVRGTDMIAISGASALVSDFEFPQFRSVEYRLELYDGDTLDATISTGTISGEPAAYFATQDAYPLYNAWIQSVTQPSLNQPCFVEKFDVWKRSGRFLAKNQVLGRPNPVVVTDVMGGREGSFTFWVGNVLPYPFDETATKAEYEQLFDEGDILLFRTFNEDTNGHKPLYFAVESVDYELLTLTQETLILKYKVTVVEVDRPATGTISVSDVLWDDVSDTFPSWTSVNSNRSTWFEVLQDPTL